MQSQEPSTRTRCHKSLSASLAFLPVSPGKSKLSQWRESQKPFGFFGISACSYELVENGEIIASHKSLSASLAFLPSRGLFQVKQVRRKVTKAFRLLWHFCPSESGRYVSPGGSHKSLSASLAFLPIRKGNYFGLTYRKSQKPFGFFGISAQKLLRHGMR